MESTVVASKEQELKALAQIRRIVKGLGPNSYIGTAMAGVWDIAEQNIDFDAAISFPESIDQLCEELAAAKKERDGYKGNVEELEAENKRLADALDAELEWKPCDGGTNMAQEDYEKLAQACEAETVTEQQAQKLIADEFGFDPAKVIILDKAATYEANRHHFMRVAKEYDRAPVYNATDWNYIRFNCANWQFEMINGDLRFYNC